MSDTVTVTQAPTEPGYYWAKLKTPSGGNFYCAGLPPEMQGVRIEPEMNDDGSCAWASTDWEIVEVWENVMGGYDPNDDESLAVSVPGVPITQWPQDFFWGPKIEALRTSTRPASEDAAIQAAREAVARLKDADGAHSSAECVRRGDWDDVAEVRYAILGAHAALSAAQPADAGAVELLREAREILLKRGYADLPARIGATLAKLGGSDEG